MKPIRFESFVAVFALAAALGVPKAAEGANAFTWMSASPGNWTTVGNWDNGSTYPHTSSDDAKFTDAAAATVNADGIILHALSVDGADSAVLTGAGRMLTLTDDLPMYVSNGRLVIDGGLCVTGSTSGACVPISFDYSGSVRPEICVTNASSLILCGGSSSRVGPSHGRILVTGSGSTYRMTGHAIRWSSGAGCDMIYEADDDGVITLGDTTTTTDGGWAQFGAATASDVPVRYIARNGGIVRSLVPYNRVEITPGPAEILLENGGTFMLNRGGLSSGTASAWKIEVDDANFRCNLPLVRDNEVVFRHSHSGSSVVSSSGPYLYDSSSAGNTFAFLGAQVSGDFPIKLTGTDNTYLVSNASVTVSAAISATDTSALNTKLVFRGTTPVLRGTAAGGTTLGYSSAPAKYSVIRFEPEENGFAAAPFEPSYAAASKLYEYFPIEIDASRMRNTMKVTIPLITWTKGISGTKPTAEAIQSHLASGAIPGGCELSWQDNTLCVTIPPMVTAGHGLIWRLEPKAKN